MVRTVISMNSIDRALRDAHDSRDDDSGHPAAFREDLLNIARTTLSSKVVLHDKDHFAELCVDAVMRLNGSTNIDMVQIIKKTGGTMMDSYLEEGFILDGGGESAGGGRRGMLLHPSAIEAATSAMEVMAVAATNAALLVRERL